MNIGILRIGKVDADVTDRVRENLNTAFLKAKCSFLPEEMSLPEEAFSKKRQQYRSEVVLNAIATHSAGKNLLDRILGVVDADLFVPRLNFVFGEAECPGKAAVVSLWRLRPEFYGKPANIAVFAERSTKESMHELGHTLGLKHCLNPFCVMHFSNSIFETDHKHGLFCNKCCVIAQTLMDKSRRKL